MVMEPTKVVFNGINYYRQPKSRHRTVRVYYRSNKIGGKVLALHREIWKNNFGKIPKGFHIHHKDGNTFNNSVNNLECISASNHARLHSNSKDRIEKLRQTQKTEKRKKAAEDWRKSKEGIMWYAKHSIREKMYGKETKRVCEHCGISYMTKLKRNTKFCSEKCRLRFHYKKHYRKYHPKLA